MSIGILAIVISVGLGLGWVLHRRAARRMTPALRRLGVETNGSVSQLPFSMPRLTFSRAGAEVEVSAASTGSEGDSIEYTYVRMSGLAAGRFEFRIRPRSVQTILDAKIGRADELPFGSGDLDGRLSVSTNDPRLMNVVLGERVREDLLLWARGKGANRIADVRNDGDTLLYAVRGVLTTHADLRSLLDAAVRLYDAVDEASAKGPGSASRDGS